MQIAIYFYFLEKIKNSLLYVLEMNDYVADALIEFMNESLDIFFFLILNSLSRTSNDLVILNDERNFLSSPFVEIFVDVRSKFKLV